MLQYQITRDFRWRWFTPISLGLAFVVLVFLTLVNVPLTGYETITVFQDNYNATKWLWYYRFMPFRIPKPGSTCEPYVLNLSDSFTSNYSYFEWKVDSIVKPTAGDSSVSYTGLPLTSCDILLIFIDGNLLSWNIDFTVVVACEESSFKVSAKTSFSINMLPGRYTPLLGMLRLYSNGTADQRGAILNNMLQTASTDLGNRVYNAYVTSNFTTPTIISLQASFELCPLARGPSADCSVSPPKPTIQYAAVVYPNATLLQYDYSIPVKPVTNPYVLDNDTEAPMLNLLQAIHAAIRIDLGNPSSNNFILDQTALNSTIIPSFPRTSYNQNATSLLYEQWAHPGSQLQGFLPFKIAGPAHIQAAYACHVQRRKPVGSLFVSVLVATLSMFSSGWAIFMIVAASLAKRNDPLANQCEGHYNHRIPVEAACLDFPSDVVSAPMNSASLKLEHVYEPVNST
ncbi:hypothetical protein BDN70DRAFT_679073 [Pholiota conissans]|uniref:Transmembrane protein n=1 Tax=Pholiota conissans TaxID=109636 RepID=A0A9P5ZEX3_9AGAR|nr:hypothetical protein BDN70DRAFT_679073 [Pholiota conissans]